MMRSRCYVVCFVLLILLGAWSSGIAAMETNTGNSNTITDIVHWNHPVKAVLQKYHIALSKLVIMKNNTYPVFYVRFPEDFGADTVKLYRVILEKVARANAFWDYRFVDLKQKRAGAPLTLEAICDRKDKLLKNVMVNQDVNTYQRLLTQATDREFEKVLGYLRKKVPEIETYLKMIEEVRGTKQSKEKATPIFRLDGEPDPESADVYLRDYYAVYIGENHSDHTVRWKTFLVKQDLTAILVDDPLTGDYLTLAEWRKKDPHDQ